MSILGRLILVKNILSKTLFVMSLLSIEDQKR